MFDQVKCLITGGIHNINTDNNIQKIDKPFIIQPIFPNLNAAPRTFSVY